MNALQRHIIKIGLLLAAFAIGTSTLVVVTEKATRQKILDNERQTLLNAIHLIIPEAKYNNDILADTITISANDFLATTQPTTVYRARSNNETTAAIFTSVAPDGYSGKIQLLVGVYQNGDLAGVRVISHKETPGLGDKIDARKSTWIDQFSGLSLTNPELTHWKVKKDGGDFDQFTGATITPRAVVKAVKNALLYYDQHHDELFQVHNEPTP